MQRLLIRSVGVTVLLSLAATLAAAQSPKRDFMVDLRQVVDQTAGGFHAGTQASPALLGAQSVAVRNGEKATLRLNVSMPMQWVQKLEAQPSANQSAAPGTAPGAVQGITNAVIWMDAGQSLVVTPRWPGGKQPVTVEVDLQTAATDDRTGAELPNQARSQTSTTVSAPLGDWVILATEGQARASGSYSSSTAKEVQRSIQIRVRPAGVPF